MSISAVNPALSQAAITASQALSQSAGTDSDGDNDGSAPVSALPSGSSFAAYA
jgi:hypothetical protein